MKHDMDIPDSRPQPAQLQRRDQRGAGTRQDQVRPGSFVQKPPDEAQVMAQPRLETGTARRQPGLDELHPFAILRIDQRLDQRDMPGFSPEPHALARKGAHHGFEQAGIHRDVLITPDDRFGDGDHAKIRPEPRRTVSSPEPRRRRVPVPPPAAGESSAPDPLRRQDRRPFRLHQDLFDQRYDHHRHEEHRVIGHRKCCSGHEIADEADLHHPTQMPRPLELRLPLAQPDDRPGVEPPDHADPQEDQQPDRPLIAQHLEIDAVRRPLRPARNILVEDGAHLGRRQPSPTSGRSFATRTA